MRVTERSRIDTLTLNENRAATRLADASRVASSGQRVQAPSDDPAAYGSLVRRDYTVAMLDQRSQSAADAESELEVASNSLSSGVDIVQNAIQTAITGANSSETADTRKTLAEDVRTMRDELFSVANTKYGDKYLFAGTRTDTQPFDTTSGAFSGNDQIVKVPVLDGVNTIANVSGAQTFTAANGGRDIFADMKSLADALDANDVPGIQAALQPLQQGFNQIVKSEVTAGFTAERFRNAQDVLTSTKTAVAASLSKDIDGDPAQQLTELTLAKNAYDQSVEITKQLLSISTSASQ